MPKIELVLYVLQDEEKSIFQHFGQGKIEFSQGKVNEKSRNFVSD